MELEQTNNNNNTNKNHEKGSERKKVGFFVCLFVCFFKKVVLNCSLWKGGEVGGRGPSDSRKGS